MRAGFTTGFAPSGKVVTVMSKVVERICLRGDREPGALQRRDALGDLSTRRRLRALALADRGAGRTEAGDGRGERGGDVALSRASGARVGV
jgi:hypothetical protein